VADGTYFVVQSRNLIVAGGGWSKRRMLYGAALERYFSVFARIAARAAGFHRFEIGATLTGVPLYAAPGYAAAEQLMCAISKPGFIAKLSE